VALTCEHDLELQICPVETYHPIFSRQGGWGPETVGGGAGLDVYVVNHLMM
jgi:hypothetical protein